MSNEFSAEEREQLLERVRKAEQVAIECQGEAATYRHMLETCYEAAQKASDTKNVSYLHTITHRLAFTVPSEHEMKGLGQIFLNACKRDSSWLSRTKEALEKIKVEAQQLDVDKESSNSEVKDRIIELAEWGLIIHI
jgi:hypothetical protein